MQIDLRSSRDKEGEINERMQMLRIHCEARGGIWIRIFNDLIFDVKGGQDVSIEHNSRILFQG
jgi:hypothetical protein